jgi:hypothetical protein
MKVSMEGKIIGPAPLIDMLMHFIEQLQSAWQDLQQMTPLSQEIRKNIDAHIARQAFDIV